MAKVQRLITLSIDINERLTSSRNASALIEHLLENHFANKVIEEGNIEEIEGEEKRLKRELDSLKVKREVIGHKDTLKAELREIGVVDDNLISQLIKQHSKPSVHTAKHIKESFNLNSVLQVYNAWNLVHPEKVKEHE